MCVCHFFGCAIALLHTFCGKIAKNCYFIVIFKSLVSNWLTVHFQNLYSFTNILPSKTIRLFMSGSCHLDRALNVKYLLLLSFLSAAEF